MFKTDCTTKHNPVETMEHSKQLLLKNLRKVAQEQGYEVDNANIKSITTDGANYSSHLFQITLKSQGKPDLNLFAKVASISKDLRNSFSIRLFDAEELLYTKINSAHEKLLNAHNIPIENRFRSPKFYGICTDDSEEVLILEDLYQSGYGMFDRHKPIDLEYAKEAATQLAYFHAFSLVYALHNPDEFKNLVKSVERNIEFIEIMAKQHASFTKNALEVVEEAYKERVEKFVLSENGPKNLMGFYRPIGTTFLVHGDFRASNLMHKIKNNRYNVVTMDYQIIMPGSPATDLIFFLFLGSDEEFRKKHLVEIVDHYYTQLSMQLKRFNLDPEVVYPKKTWNQEFKEKLPFSLSLAIILLPVVLVENNDAPEVNTITDFKEFVVKPSEAYPKRLNGIIRDFVRWELI